MLIKYLQLNILHGGKLFQPLIEFIRKEDADIVALQEVFDSHDQKLAARFRTVSEFTRIFRRYHIFFSPEFLGKFGENWLDTGNMIMSKYRFVSKKTVYLKGKYGKYLEFPHLKDYSVHPKNMQQAEIQIGRAILNVCNLHGIWGFDGWDNPDRLEMSRIIVNTIKGKPRLIMSGDFNVRPETNTIRNIEKYLTNVFKGELKTSFNLKRKISHIGGYSQSVVDYIFTSPEIKIMDHYCPPVDVSDHLPLVCVFEI